MYIPPSKRAQQAKGAEKFRNSFNIPPRDEFRSRAHDNRTSRKTPYECQDQPKNAFRSFAGPKDRSTLSDKDTPLQSTSSNRFQTHQVNLTTYILTRICSFLNWNLIYNFSFQQTNSPPSSGPSTVTSQKKQTEKVKLNYSCNNIISRTLILS